MKKQLAISRGILYLILLLYIPYFATPVMYRNPIWHGLQVLLPIIITLVSYFANGRRREVADMFRVSLLVTILLFTNYVAHDGQTGFGGMLTVILFCLYAVAAKSMVLTEKDYHILSITSLLFILIYPLLPQSINGYSFNENTPAHFYFAFGVYATLFLRNRGRELIWMFIIVAYCIVGTYASGCRSALIAFAVYILIRFAPLSILKNRMVYILLVVTLTVGNLVYVYFYTSSWLNGADMSAIANLNSDYSDKQVFSGRQGIWYDLWVQFKQKPMIGTGTDVRTFQYENGGVNTHNSMMLFYMLHGLPIGILCTTIIFTLLLPLRKYLDNYIIKNCVSLYAGFAIMGFFETVLVNGGEGPRTYLCLLLIA